MYLACLIVQVVMNIVCRYVYATTWIGWLMCFGIVLLVPVDVNAVCFLLSFSSIECGGYECS